MWSSHTRNDVQQTDSNSTGSGPGKDREEEKHNSDSDSLTEVIDEIYDTFGLSIAFVVPILIFFKILLCAKAKQNENYTVTQIKVHIEECKEELQELRESVDYLMELEECFEEQEQEQEQREWEQEQREWEQESGEEIQEKLMKNQENGGTPGLGCANNATRESQWAENQRRWDQMLEESLKLSKRLEADHHPHQYRSNKDTNQAHDISTSWFGKHIYLNERKRQEEEEELRKWEEEELKRSQANDRLTRWLEKHEKERYLEEQKRQKLVVEQQQQEQQRKKDHLQDWYTKRLESSQRSLERSEHSEPGKERLNTGTGIDQTRIVSNGRQTIGNQMRGMHRLPTPMGRRNGLFERVLKYGITRGRRW